MIGEKDVDIERKESNVVELGICILVSYLTT